MVIGKTPLCIQTTVTKGSHFRKTDKPFIPHSIVSLTCPMRAEGIPVLPEQSQIWEDDGEAVQAMCPVSLSTESGPVLGRQDQLTGDTQHIFLRDTDWAATVSKGTQYLIRIYAGSRFENKRLRGVWASRSVPCLSTVDMTESPIFSLVYRGQSDNSKTSGPDCQSPEHSICPDTIEWRPH